MQVIIVGKKKVYKKVLPENPEQNEIIKDKWDRTIINIIAENGKWGLHSSKNVSVIDFTNIDSQLASKELSRLQDRVRKKVFLEENKVYGIKYANTDHIFLLYCLPTYDFNWKELQIKDAKEISIGSFETNHICFRNFFVRKYQAKMTFENGKWYIQNNDSKYGVFVSDRYVGRTKSSVANGEVIFVMGMKIIFIGERVFITNPWNQVVCDDDILVPRIIEIPKVIKEELPDESIDLEKEYFYTSPRIIRKIERAKIKIDTPPPPERQDQVPLILTIGSSLTMGAMLLMSIVSMVRGISNPNSALIDILVSCIYVLTTILGMLIIPILTKKMGKAKKKSI